MFEPYNEAIMAVIEKYKDANDRGAYESLQNGHRNMLRNAMFSFYQSGHRQYAQKIYDQLRELYPLPEFQVPLVEYARKRMLEELESLDITNAKEQILAILKEGYYLYAIHDDSAAFGREGLAKQIHEYYTGMYLDENRINLPDFKLLKYLALVDFLNDQQFSPYLKATLLNRIEVERPDLYSELKQMADRIGRSGREHLCDHLHKQGCGGDASAGLFSGVTRRSPYQHVSLAVPVDTQALFRAGGTEAELHDIRRVGPGQVHQAGHQGLRSRPDEFSARAYPGSHFDTEK